MGRFGNWRFHWWMSAVILGLAMAVPAWGSYLNMKALRKLTYMPALRACPGLAWFAVGGPALPIEDGDKEEARLRRVIQENPGDWRPWVSLGKLQADQAVSWNKAANRKEEVSGPIKTFVLGLTGKTPAFREQSMAKQFRDEAEFCFNQAVALAPGNPGPLFQRIQFYLHVTIALGLVQPPPEIRQRLVADLDQLLQLEPGDCKALGMKAFLEAVAASRHGLLAIGKTNLWAKLSETNKQPVRASLARLEQLSRDSNPREAAAAHEMLGLLHWFLQADQAQAIVELSKATLLDPDRDKSWEMLLSLLYEAGQKRDCFIACRNWLMHKETARARVMLAKLFEDEKNLDLAEKELQTVLSTNPQDFWANVYLAILWLHLGFDRDTLADVHVLLDRAGAARDKSAREQESAYLIARAILSALEDNLAPARRNVGQVLHYDGHNHQARQLLYVFQDATTYPGLFN